MRIHNDKSSKRRRLVRRRYRTAQNDGEGEQPLAVPEAWRIQIAVKFPSIGLSSRVGYCKLSNVPFILSEYMILNTSVSLGQVSSGGVRNMRRHETILETIFAGKA